MATKTFQVSDLARSVAFYTGNLGLSVLGVGPTEATLTGGVDDVRLIEAAPVTTSQQRFWVDDVQRLFPMVQATGTVPPTARVTWKRWGTHEFTVADLDDNILTMCSASVT